VKEWFKAALRVLGKSLATALATFVATYVGVGANFGYTWTAYEIQDGQNGLGQLLTFLYSSLAAAISFLLAALIFALREVDKSKFKT
jgi:hypothetical protein